MPYSTDGYIPPTARPAPEVIPRDMSGGVRPVLSLKDVRVGDRVAVSVIPGHFVSVDDLPRKWGNITEISPENNRFRISPFANKTL